LDAKKATKLLVDLELMYARSRRVRDLNSEILREGMAMLLECHSSLATTDAYKKTIAWLQGIDSYFKQALCKVLGLLVGCGDWPTWDIAVVEQEDFEISAIIWALKLGPLGLATGKIQGKGVPEILLAAEEKWVLDNADKIEFEDDKAALECFVGKLRLWGMEVLADGAGEEES
jgi:hypothetical protein